MRAKLLRTTHRLLGRLVGVSLRRESVPIYVMSPAYNPLSGGIRAMHLLAYRLVTLGYQAYVTPAPEQRCSAPHPIRYLDDESRARHQADAIRIAVYPEIVAGNPLGAEIVVRYLLNRPGIAQPSAEASYGVDDIFLTFDADHLPPGRRGMDLFAPLVDRRWYYPPAELVHRSGALLFAHRERSDELVALLPDRLRPVTVVSMAAVRSPRELGDLYRRAGCMVIGERSTAIYEALCCGCPVFCIASGAFQEASYQRRFQGAGLAWSAADRALVEAAATIPIFTRLYDALEASFDSRIQTAFDPVVRHALTRFSSQPLRRNQGRTAVPSGR